MRDLNVYYQIVPKGDGYTYLCRDKNTGELYLHEKVTGNNPDVLVFSSKEAAEEWIDVIKPLDRVFKAEWFATMNVIETFEDIKKTV